METVNIEDLQETNPELAIEIRVIRRWVTRLVPEETCYIFVDKHADGIHAVAASSYKLSYSTPLALQGCYRISCFSCNDPPTYLKTIDRPVALRFGATATIAPLEDSVIYPKLYFDFTEYENLIESTPTVDVFTDFIGLIDHVVDARTQDNAPYIRLYLKDGRNNITATLWKEIIMSDERFNRTTLDNTPRPCTVAITSVKVSKHKGWFQLTSTPATYTYINPACDQSTSLLQRSRFSPQRSMISHNVSSSSSVEKRRLSSLLEIDHHQTPGQIYMCEARISEFIPGVPWFKRYCNIVSCTEKVSPSSNKYFCVTHGLSDTCRYMFMPTTTIADADTSATAVLYDDAAQSVIGQSCSEFVTSLSAADPMVLPEALLTARNAYFTFFLKIKPNTKAGVTTFIIERADPISLTTGSVTPHTPQPITETNRQTSASDVARPLFHDTASPSTEKLKKQRQE